MVERESNRTYALVTGASQGLGLAFCKALARRQHHLIMVSLPEQRLDKTAEYIRNTYSVDVIYVETDLSSLASCEHLIRELLIKQYKIDILINNAGIGSNGSFTSFDLQFYEKQIALNCQTPVFLCRLLIPEMKKLEKAYILNVGSLGAYFDMPYKEVYCASKLFLISFTRSLFVSLKNTPITISVVCPGSIDTNDRLRKIHEEMKGIAKKSIMLPDDVAEEAIEGLFSGKTVFITGKINRFFYRLNKYVPQRIQRYFVDREMLRQEKLKQSASDMPRKV